MTPKNNVWGSVTLLYGSIKFRKINVFCKNIVISVLTLTFNIYSCTGQEIEKEKSHAPDLQIIQSRIRDVIHVLADFK